MSREYQSAQVVAEALRSQSPLKDLPGVSILDVQEEPEQPFDISFVLQSGSNRVQVLAEVKSAFSPRTLEEIAPWIQRLKSLRPDVAVAVIAPSLSPQAQTYSRENGIDFMDLAGNVSINVPGKFTLQRTGMRSQEPAVSTKGSQSAMNVFSGRSSRILRVLLENPTNWTITELSRELAKETTRFRQVTKTSLDFAISLGSVSKTIAALEDQLLVRRRGAEILVPEPLRMLRQWAEKYKERYRWRLRQSFQTNNPFGRELEGVAVGLDRRAPGTYAFTSAIAASIKAPFIDIDVLDIFVASGQNNSALRTLNNEPSKGPRLRFVLPYDDGILMYSRKIESALVVSDVQAYLDLYAKGGRDLKQAEYLLSNSIQSQWGAA